MIPASAQVFPAFAASPESQEESVSSASSKTDSTEEEAVSTDSSTITEDALYAPDPKIYPSIQPKDKYGTVTITYTEGTEGNDPVAGAEFTLYKIADFTSLVNGDTEVGTRYQPIIPGLIIRETADGESTFEIVDDGVIDSNDSTEEGSSEAAAEAYAKDGTGKYSSQAGSDRKISPGEYQQQVQTPDEGRSGSDLDTMSKTIVTVDTQPSQFLKVVKSAYQHEGFGKTYIGTTDKNGKLVFKDVEPAAYLMAETKPADHHYASVPCLISVPEMKTIPGSSQEGWNYDVQVQPKSIPGGDLKINKKIAGDAAENKTFHFLVTFTSAGYTGTSESSNKDNKRPVYLDPTLIRYEYVNSNGQKGEIQSGGTLRINPDETVTIKNIPVGTMFQVSEDEANESGYVTTVTGSKGHIKRKEVQTASFLNTRNKDKSSGWVPTGDFWKYALIGCILAAAAVLLAVSRKKGTKTVKAKEERHEK